MAQLFLKDLVGMTSDKMLTARIAGIGPTGMNKNNKGFRKVQFLFPSTGKTHEEGVFEFNFTGKDASMAGARVGSTVEITLKGVWPVFRIVGANAESSQPTTQTSQQQVKNERQTTATINQNDDKQEEKSIAISIQGFMQSFLSTGNYKIDEALDLAVEAREKCLKKAKDIRLGIDTPTQAVSQAEIDSISASSVQV